MIDTHCHINDKAFNEDVEGYIKDANAQGVTHFICVGYDLKSSIKAVNLSKKYSCIYAAVGIHPSELVKMNSNDFNEIEKLISNEKVIAVGEIGLDYYWEKDPAKKEQQKEYFIRFINLANKYNLPIIIHSRDATNDTYEIVKNNLVTRGGIVHCYAAGKDYVDRYIKLGFYFGIGGTVTFKNAVNVKEAVKIIPLEKLLLETDAPYLAPVPFRGTTNHSKYIPYIVDTIASLKNTSKQEICDITDNNFKKLFKKERL